MAQKASIRELKNDDGEFEAMTLSRVTIIADDLTGACDAAAPFAERGRQTVVLTEKQPLERFDAEIVAVSTDTRDVDREVLEQYLHQHFKLLPDRGAQGLLFKKIDSALRGNTCDEIAIFSRLFAPRILVVSPAFPALGRTMKRGVQRIRNELLPQEIDIGQALDCMGMKVQCFRGNRPAVELRGEAIASIEAGSHVLLFDAESQEDLQTTVEALMPLQDQLLWVGSAGLAQALAVLFSMEKRHAVMPRPGRVVFFIGSDHPITQSQLIRLRADHLMVECTPFDPCPEASIVVCRLERGASSNQTSLFLRDTDPNDIGCIFVSGGDTANHLFRALTVSAIEIYQEFARGVPFGVLRGGPMDGVHVITKSGGFGDEDLLSRIAAIYANEMGEKQ